MPMSSQLTHAVLWPKGEFFYKNPFKEISPQIAISESTKSGRKKLIFSRFMQKPLQIHTGTKNRLNTLYTDC